MMDNGLIDSPQEYHRRVFQPFNNDNFIIFELFCLLAFVLFIWEEFVFGT